MIKAVGYTDEGSIFTQFVLEIEKKPHFVTMHMTPANAQKLAGDLVGACNQMEAANHERDRANADQGGP